MDYNSLVGSTTTAGSVAQWINHSSAQAAAPTILAEAESFIYRRLRHWKMTSETTGAFVIGNDYLTLPTDYLEDRTLYITGVNFGRLRRKTLETVKAGYQYDGTGTRVNQRPNIFYNNATQFKFDSPSDQTYPYELVYYAQPAALSVSNTTNFLTILYPELVRQAVMVGAAEFMKDIGQGTYDRTYWVQKVAESIVTAQTESDRAQRSMEEGALIL